MNIMEHNTEHCNQIYMCVQFISLCLYSRNLKQQTNKKKKFNQKEIHQSVQKLTKTIKPLIAPMSETPCLDPYPNTWKKRSI